MMLVRLGLDPSDAGAQKVFEALKAHGILVKNVSKMHPVLKGCLRLTIGSSEENDALIKALGLICAQMH